jgi:HPt (histidine-containing phosphotransfer) domain-containing protein
MSDTPAIDWEQLDMIADGYTPDFVEIYREFEVDLPRILGEAKASIAAGDAARAARAAHQAKGSAANFGFTGFSAMMARVETRAKSGEVAGLSEDVQTAERLFFESVALVKGERPM